MISDTSYFKILYPPPNSPLLRRFNSHRRRMSETKPHILIFPYPGQGHMIPLLDFTHLLSISGLTLTVLVTPNNLPLLNPLLSKHPSIQTLVLPFPADPNIPAGVENVKDLPAGGFRSMMYTLGQLHDPIHQWFKNHPSPPTAIVYDIFLGFCHRLCTDLGVPGYVFSPSGARAVAIIYSLWRDLPKRKNEDENEELIRFSKIPNRPVYPWWQLSTVYRSYAADESHQISKFIKANFDGDLSSHGLIINTFSRLETIYLDHLKESLGHNRVWAIGPVHPGEEDDDDDNSVGRGGSSSVSADEISSWLDKCENHTVLYVCFGSQAVLTNEQMEALTMALEKSEIKFILSVKAATKGHREIEKYGRIPPEFERRVKGKGILIKGWSPQVLILKHPATGAFLSHCGWNSVLEGIVAGVPFLAWPMGADQFSNANLIVDELKIGVRVCEGDKTVPDVGKIAEMMAKAIGSEFEDERKRAVELRKAAVDAVREGGSSFRSLDDLVKHFCGEEALEN